MLEIIWAIFYFLSLFRIENVIAFLYTHIALLC